MAEKAAQTTSDPSDAPAPAAPQPDTHEARAARRTVTLPVLPFAIVGSLLVALIFFGGGVAVGLAIGGHHPRAAMIQPFTNRTEPFGGQNGFGPNDRRNGGQPGFGQDGGQNGGQNGQPGFGPRGGQNGGQPGGQTGGQDSRPVPTPAPTNG